MRKTGIAFLSGLAVLLAACGGSGGGGVSGVSYTLPTVPSGTVTIDSGNAQSVASDALTASTGAASAGPSGVTGVSVSGKSTETVKLELNTAINKANKLIVDQLRAPPSPAGVTQSYSCSTQGTVTITAVGNDSRIDYSGCGDPAIFVIDGSMAATNVSYTGSASSPTSLNVTYSYNLTFTYNSGAESISMMGRFDLAMTYDSGTFSQTTIINNGEMGVTTSAGSVVMTGISISQSCDYWDNYNYECYGTQTVSNNYTVGGTLSNGTFTIATTTDLQTAYGATYPNTGVIEVTGSNNSYLKITILDDDLGTNGAANDIELYLDPDTTTSGGETTNYYDWSTI